MSQSVLSSVDTNQAVQVAVKALESDAQINGKPKVAMNLLKRLSKVGADTNAFREKAD